MGLFDKKRKGLPEVSVAAYQPPVNYDVGYDAVLDWLVGLSDADYEKVCKVASIHRKAYQDAAAVLGDPNEPTTFIVPPDEIPESMAGRYSRHASDKTILDEDDDISAAFLEDEPKPTKPVDGIKTTKVKVK